jgi:hypothetical protein
LKIILFTVILFGPVTAIQSLFFDLESNREIFDIISTRAISVPGKLDVTYEKSQLTQGPSIVGITEQSTETAPEKTLNPVPPPIKVKVTFKSIQFNKDLDFSVFFPCNGDCGDGGVLPFCCLYQRW